MAAMRRPSPRKKIAERLKRLRIEAGITQDVAARKMRLTIKQWGRIENGHQSIPAERLTSLAALVKTDVEYLLGVPRAERAEREAA